MSRTFRRDIVQLDCNDMPYPYGTNWYDLDIPLYHTPHYDYFSKRNSRRDRKLWSKSPKWFKKMKGRGRKAKIRQAMAHRRYDNIPHFRRTNDWEWT